MKRFTDLKIGSSVWKTRGYNIELHKVTYLMLEPVNEPPLKTVCKDYKSRSIYVERGNFDPGCTQIKGEYGGIYFFNLEEAIKHVKQEMIKDVLEERRKILKSLDQIDEILPRFLNYHHDLNEERGLNEDL